MFFSCFFFWRKITQPVKKNIMQQLRKLVSPVCGIFFYSESIFTSKQYLVTILENLFFRRLIYKVLPYWILVIFSACLIKMSRPASSHPLCTVLKGATQPKRSVPIYFLSDSFICYQGELVL